MLIHGDGFALYGTGSASRTNMTQGAWAQVDAPIQVSTSNPRGHGTHHLRFASVQGDIVRRVLGADYGDGLGFGAAYYFTALPTDNASHLLFQARDGANAAQFSVTLSTTGVIQVRRGGQSAAVIAATTSPVMVAGAYQHMELFAVCGNAGGSPGGGSIEIRVNGQTVLNESDIDLQNNATNSVEQYAIGESTGSPIFTGTMDVADIQLWDTTGSVNNDFLGDVQWLAIYPIADRAAQEWTPLVTGNGYEMVDDSTGPDGESAYIEAPFGSPGAISEFDMTDAPALTSDIVGVVLQPMLRKTDAGDGSAQMSVISSEGSPETVDAGADKPLTQVYTYYPEVFETDPATGVRWTIAGFNAMAIRLQRTA